MNVFTPIKLGFTGIFLAGCAAVAVDAVSQVTGQTENGSETYSGQITGYEISLTSNRGRVCTGRPAPNPVVLTCSDGTGGSLELHARDLFIGGTGAGTIDNQTSSLVSVHSIVTAFADGQIFRVYSPATILREQKKCAPI